MQVFDLTTELPTSEKIQSFNSLHSKKIKEYIVKNYSENIVKVTIYNEDNTSYACLYREVSKEDVYKCIIDSQELDLSGCYINNFNIEEVSDYTQYKIKIRAPYSFWDGSIYFREAHFDNEPTNFAYSTFGYRNAVFWGVSFGDGGVNFSHTNFISIDVLFLSSTFGNGDINFMCTNFGNGEVDFSWVDFGANNVIFDLANFGHSQVDFSKAIFGGSVTFEEAKFVSGIISFHSTVFYRNSFNFVNVKYEGDKCCLDFNDIKWTTKAMIKAEGLDILKIENCIIESIMHIDGYPLNLSLKNTIIIGRIIYPFARKLKKAINAYNKKMEYPTNYEKARQYQVLKENYHTLGFYEDEDKAYREFMHYRNSYGLRKLIRLFGLVGGYGTNPWTIFPAIFATWFGFAALYFYTLADQFVPALNSFWDALYYSGITFLTIGYGDIAPLCHTMKFLSIAEGFLGLFLMSYFTVAVVRKLLR